MLIPILTGLLVLASLGAFCLCFSACTRYDAALLPLPTLSGAVVVLYISALPGMLHVGLFLVLAILLATGVYCGVRAGARAVRDAMGSAGFWLFLGGAAFLWVLFGILQPMFTQWDEFTAWGLAPKMVAERAALYVADPVNLTASFTYPATSLLSYLFQRTPGQFSEWQCMAAIDILALAALAPATVLPRARWGQGILVFAVGAVLPFFFSTAPAGTASTVYQNAMADLPLAALFGGSLCLYYAGGGRRTCFYATALPLAMLAMTKDIGLAYGLIAVFVIGIDQLFGTAWPVEGVTPRHVGGRFLRTAVLAVPVLAVFLSWSRYTAALAPDSGAATVGSGQMGYGAVLSGGIRQLLGIGREERFAQIMQAMGQAFFTRKVCLVGAPVMVVALVLVLTLAAAVSAPKGHARCRVVAAFLALAFCFAALYVFHLILYFYNFSEEEGSALKDYERYLTPYLQGWVLATFCLLGQASSAIPVRAWQRRAGAGMLALATAGVLGIFAWRGVPTAGFWTRADSVYTTRADVKSRAAVMNEVLDWGDRVLVISQGDDATRWYYYKYELTAKVVNGYGGVWWGDGDYSNRWDSDFMNLVESLNWDLYEHEAVCSVNSLEAYMEEKGCTYLVLDRADDYLERDFSDRFEGGITADQPATLYKFMGRDAAYSFVPVAVAESGVVQ